jgi:predicted CXXCH cytochrome family protein
MTRFYVTLIPVAFAFSSCGHKEDRPISNPTPKITLEEVTPIIQEHCLSCHKKAPSNKAKVLEKLEAKAMPPPKVSKLSDLDRQKLIDFFNQ